MEVFDQLSAINTEAEAVSRYARRTPSMQWPWSGADCETKSCWSGKSGLSVGRLPPISTGTPAYFLHVKLCTAIQVPLKRRMWCLISNSETSEVLNLAIPRVVVRIAITSGRDSTLARLCDIALVYGYEREADHLNLAPTTSAALTLVIGDALAVALSILK